jgi:HK97 gp10 family phage protein
MDAARNQLADLGEAVQYRALRAGLKAAGEVVKKKVIQGARRVEDSGLLADATRMHITTQKSTGRVTAHIRPAGSLVIVEQTGPDGRKRQKRTRASAYAHLVEFGGQHVSPRPYARPAIETTAAAREAAFTEQINKGITRALKKRAKN